MKLFVIGVGPGEPELITLKGYKILQKINLIFYPKGGKENVALSIVENLISKDEKILIELPFPMVKEKDLTETWETLAETIINWLKKEIEGVFLTLGDPAFYCTYYYVKDFLLQKGVETEIIPGITSFSLASARFNIPLTLGNERAHIVPAEEFFKDLSYYKEKTTIILMKVHKYIKEILEFSKTNHFNCYIGYRLGQKKEKLWYNISNLEELQEDLLDYFTIAILKK
ncbi:MAG: precorrin-2 C(20)-methyltransferase [Caldimicrobium sp.]